MNLAEAAAFRALAARVDALERLTKEQQRRLDDLSAAERARTEAETNQSTLRLKKSG
jgi:hypothetical protein